MPKNQTQKQKLLNQFERGRRIDESTAYEKFGVTNLRARVWELRKEGHDIETVTRTLKSGPRKGQKETYYVFAS